MYSYKYKHGCISHYASISYSISIIIIVIMMWFVQQTLLFQRAPYMPVSFVLNDKQLLNQR